MKACLPVLKMLISIAFLPITAFGQLARPVSNTAPAYSYNDGTDQLTSNVPLNEINVRAYRHFRRKWPMVESEAWYKSGEGYLVSFMEKGIRNQAHFDRKGGFLYSMKYYGGKDIPAELAGLIEKKFPGYQIDVVTEMTDEEKSVCLIKIENSSSVKTLSFADGKLEVYEELVNGGINSRLVRN